jgi:putative oxidoreductase
VHVPNGWMFTAPNGGWEYPVFLVLALAAQAMLGDGAWALSNRSRRFENATASALGHLADSGRS